MENRIREMPRELPNRKYYNKPTQTKSISIIQKSNDDNVSREQFDPSSFSSSPPNEFLKFLKQRIERY
jgi:hypothetical protein